MSNKIFKCMFCKAHPSALDIGTFHACVRCIIRVFKNNL